MAGNEDIARKEEEGEGGEESEEEDEQESEEEGEEEGEENDSEYDDPEDYVDTVTDEGKCLETYISKPCKRPA